VRLGRDGAHRVRIENCPRFICEGAIVHECIKIHQLFTGRAHQGGHRSEFCRSDPAGVRHAPIEVRIVLVEVSAVAGLELPRVLERAAGGRRREFAQRRLQCVKVPLCIVRQSNTCDAQAGSVDRLWTSRPCRDVLASGDCHREAAARSSLGAGWSVDITVREKYNKDDVHSGLGTAKKDGERYPLKTFEVQVYYAAARTQPSSIKRS